MQKLAGLVMDGASNMTRRKTGVLLLVTNDMKNIMDRCVIISHCLIDQENLYAKSFEMTNVFGVVSKPVNFIWLKGMNHCQFKVFLSDMKSENGGVPYYTEAP